MNFKGLFTVGDGDRDSDSDIAKMGTMILLSTIHSER